MENLKEDINVDFSVFDSQYTLITTFKKTLIHLLTNILTEKQNHNKMK